MITKTAVYLTNVLELFFFYHALVSSDSLTVKSDFVFATATISPSSIS